MAEQKEQLWVVLDWDKLQAESVNYYDEIIQNEKNLSEIAKSFNLVELKQSSEFDIARTGFLKQISLASHQIQPAITDRQEWFTRVIMEQTAKDKETQEKNNLVNLLEDKRLLASVVYSSNSLEIAQDAESNKWEAYVADYSHIENEEQKIKEMLSHTQNRPYKINWELDDIRARLKDANQTMLSDWKFVKQDDSFLSDVKNKASEFWSEFIAWAKDFWINLANWAEFIVYNFKDYVLWWDEKEKQQLELSEFKMKYDVLKVSNDENTWFNAMLVKSKDDWKLSVVIRWTDDNKDVSNDMSFVTNDNLPVQVISGIRFIEELKREWFVNPWKPIDIVWHSLWGWLAQILWVIYKWWKENLVSNVYTFNAPWVRKMDAEVDLENLSPKEKMLINLYKESIEKSSWNPKKFNYILNIWNQKDSVFETNVHIWETKKIVWKTHWIDTIKTEEILT